MSKLTVQAPPYDTKNTQKRQEENSGRPLFFCKIEPVFFRVKIVYAYFFCVRTLGFIRVLDVNGASDRIRTDYLFITS